MLCSFSIIEEVAAHITPLLAQHDVRAGAVIYYIKENDKSILYAHDTGDFEQETWDFLSKLETPLDLITLDCTGGLRTNWSWGHLSFDCFLNVIEKLKKLNAVNEKTVIIANHFSHNGFASYDKLAKIAKKHNVIVSYDGMEVEF